MQTMLTAFATVAMMLLYALPGFLFIKLKVLKESSITAFSKLLLFVCQPMIMIYTMTRVEYSPTLLGEMGIIFGVTLFLHVGMIALFWFLFRKKMGDARYRIYTLGTCLGNYGFMGIPILKALLPEFPNTLAVSAMCAISLHAVTWTAGCSVISQDKRYISLKKILLNPASIGLYIALPFFFANLTPGETITSLLGEGFGKDFGKNIDTMITLLADMATPLCMIIMGMRLGITSYRAVFGRPALYLIIAIKQLLLPLATFCLLLVLPLSSELSRALCILIACPVAAMVQNFAELLGAGQDTGAGIVLLSTALSALTIPLIALLLPLL